MVNVAVGTASNVTCTLSLAEQPFCVTVTVYPPVAVTLWVAVVGPFDHTMLEAVVAAVSTKVLPAHAPVSGPAYTDGMAETVTVSGAEVADPHAPVAVTVNIPGLYSVIEGVVARLLHTGF